MNLVVLTVIAFLAGGIGAARLNGLAAWAGAAIAAASAAGFLIGRSAVPGDATIPFLLGLVGAGAIGSLLRLGAQATGMVLVGAIIAAAVVFLAGRQFGLG
ncbi:hypothetical protein [Prosthecodimorpha staleyi]|uniref:Uncharacterized protein n=1 Tax=Prosthecodimorpha staleyi TaxID=2840188 RepID=A0A947GJ82_9HYPH|nr:hypothetical protein [Prosthecodimorpha staleyi]MBT9291154.1 hypothetical protein [Prosthecodimorpha staleyi]